MVNTNNIISFLNFNYTPFSKKQCIVRLIVIWTLSSLCCIGKFSFLMICVSLIFNIAISTIFCILMVKHQKAKISRYLCDGLTYLYISIILNIASYNFLTLEINESWILSIIFLILLFLCICSFLLLVYFNIKSDKYTIESNIKKSFFSPLIGSVCGIAFTKLFLQNVSMDISILIVSMILLILSFALSIGSLNLLKALFIVYLKKSHCDKVDY